MEVINLTADVEFFTCNTYLVTGRRPTLIDAGAVPDGADRIREEVEALDAVLVTHQHGDHLDALPDIVEAFDPVVAAFAPHETRTDALRDGEDVLIGDEEFEVVPTPGHAADHVAFVGEHRLFSGDVLVHDDGAFDYGSFGRTDGPNQSREELIESLERLLERLPDGVSHLHPGHGSEHQGDVRDVIEVAHWRASKREPKYDE